MASWPPKSISGWYQREAGGREIMAENNGGLNGWQPGGISEKPKNKSEIENDVESIEENGVMSKIGWHRKAISERNG
jgi:hypothetical protein